MSPKMISGELAPPPPFTVMRSAPVGVRLPPPCTTVIEPSSVASIVNSSSPWPSMMSTTSTSWYVIPAAKVRTSGAAGVPKSKLRGPPMPRPPICANLVASTSSVGGSA